MYQDSLVKKIEKDCLFIMKRHDLHCEPDSILCASVDLVLKKGQTLENDRRFKLLRKS